MAKYLLNALDVHNAKPKAKPYRLFDGDGLALLVSKTGVKSWQLRYRLNGKAQTATLGKFPSLTLTKDRSDVDEARKLAGKGEHLTAVKRAVKLQRKADAAMGSGSFRHRFRKNYLLCKAI